MYPAHLLPPTLLRAALLLTQDHASARLHTCTGANLAVIDDEIACLLAELDEDGKLRLSAFDAGIVALFGHAPC
jgi:hypothetical protein